MSFWDRVERCEHRRATNYCESGPCGNSDIGCPGWVEWRCADCGVYISDDPCRVNVGMSGWPHARWMAHWRRCEKGARDDAA